MTELTAADLAQWWAADRRWAGIARTFTAEDVVRLTGTVVEEHALARRGAERLWAALERDGHVDALGPTTARQAVEMVRAGLQAIYLPDRQIADADPARSMPGVVRKINAALLRADRIATAEGGKGETDWLVPIVADAEPGFGGHLTVFELTRAMIAAGAAGIHISDHPAPEQRRRHRAGTVIVPTTAHVRSLNAARLASDVAGVPTVVVARTNALTAGLLTSDVDDLDNAFCTGERTADGFHRVRPGIESAIHRGRAYAPYADLLWMETASPDLYEARQFAEAIRASHPEQKLAYRCSSSFERPHALDDEQIARFRRELASIGYSFQSVVPAGIRTLDRSTVCEQVA